MANNKKKEAAMIVASMGPVAPDMDNPAPDDAKQMVADEVMAAIDAKDSMAFKEAMKSFVQMCMDEYGAESEPVE